MFKKATSKSVRKKYINLLINMFIGVLWISSIFLQPISAAATTTVSLENPSLVCGQFKTLATFPLEDNLKFRSMHNLWDGTVAVFTSDKNGREIANGATPKDRLIIIDRNGNISESFNIPVHSEHPWNLPGLRGLVRDYNGNFWSVAQGSIITTIATPNFGTVVTDHRSKELVCFNTTGSVKTIDISRYLTDIQSDMFIEELAYGDGILYVKVDTGSIPYRILALNPVDGNLLYQLSSNSGQIVPMKDSQLALSNEGKISLYNQQGHLVKEINLSTINKALGTSPSYEGFIPLGGGEQYIYEQYGTWFTLDKTLQHVLGQAFINKNPWAVMVNEKGDVIQTLSRPLGENKLVTGQGSTVEVKEYLPINIKLDGHPVITDTPVYMDTALAKVWVPFRNMVDAIFIMIMTAVNYI